MRTVKRDTYDLNKGKLEDVLGICTAYSAEKRYWLDVFSSNANQVNIKTHRVVRNEAVKAGYQSPNGLQARMWKLALVDAAETWDKYWQTIFVEVRSRIFQNQSLDEKERVAAKAEKTTGKKQPKIEQNQKRYLYWLLKSYSNFTAALHGDIPLPDKFVVDSPARLVRFLQKIVRKARGKKPSIKTARSFCLDSECYDVFQNNDVQYLKIMSLTKGKRIAIPVSGQATISGNIRIVADKNTVRIHKTQSLAKKQACDPGSTESSSLDIGYTEVGVDDQGNDYGVGFGKVLTEASDRRNEKGKIRNRLHALEKKHRAEGNFAKANNIKKFNLGQVKQQAQTEAEKCHLTCMINQSINDLLRERKPSVLVTENLRGLFTFGNISSVNRKLSSWVKGSIQDRIEFKALAEGFRHEQVNPAYSSQTCPECDYVAKGNRKGDRFKCLNPRCGYEGHADQVGAINLLRRVGDPEITRYTPYQEVKNILMRRYNRRLEAEDVVQSKATVPGRTLAAVGSPLGKQLLPEKRRRSRGKDSNADLYPSANVAA